MNDEKIKNKKIIITEEDKYEGKPCIDYLISSMNDMKNKIEEIHIEISDKLDKENKNINNNLTKEEENKINEEFYKNFQLINNQDKMIEYINDINQNHIKKYTKIFKFLNLNLIAENNNNKKDIYNNEEIIDEKINEKKSNVEIFRNNEINENEKMETKEQESQINEIIIKEKINENDYILTDENNKIFEIKNSKSSQYFNNITEDDKDNELDNDNIVNNQRNKQKNISLKNLSNNTSTLIEQLTIINDNYDNNYSFYKNDNIIINTIPINQYKNEYNININNINSNNNNNQNNNYKFKENLNNKKEIKNEKNKRKQNEQKLSKKGNMNSNGTHNLLYSGIEDKSEICTCFLF